MLTKIYLYWCCVFFSLPFASSQRYIDDPCTHTASGKDGRCRLLENCPEALKDIEKQKFPQICGYQGTQSIVCCVYKPQTTTTTVATMEKIIIGEKSKQKCRKYAKYGYNKEKVEEILKEPVSSLGTHHTVDECGKIGFVSCPTCFVDGNRVQTIEEFPHMAAVGFGCPPNIAWDCGGTLISRHFVLIAAHCIFHRKVGTSAKYVRLGDLTIKEESDNEKLQQFNVEQIIEHPEYSGKHYNDIALLKLDKAAKLNPFVRPACLHTESEILATELIATDWGRDQYGEIQNDVLHKVTLEMFTTEFCNHTYRHEIASGILEHGIDHNMQFCAGSYTKEHNTCEIQDSGGPLQMFSKDYCTNIVVGITSFGKSFCAIINVPGVYTRLSHYVGWIEEVVWPSANLTINPRSTRLRRRSLKSDYKLK